MTGQHPSEPPRLTPLWDPAQRRWVSSVETMAMEVARLELPPDQFDYVWRKLGVVVQALCTGADGDE